MPSSGLREEITALLPGFPLVDIVSACRACTILYIRCRPVLLGRA